MDPSGNSIIFIQRDEPVEVEYGGSKRLQGLAKVLDNARILREFKNDDLAAFRALNSGLRRHGDSASPVEQATALAALIELSTALDKPEQVAEWGARLGGLDAERGRAPSGRVVRRRPCPPRAVAHGRRSMTSSWIASSSSTSRSEWAVTVTAARRGGR